MTVEKLTDLRFETTEDFNTTIGQLIGQNVRAYIHKNSADPEADLAKARHYATILNATLGDFPTENGHSPHTKSHDMFFAKTSTKEGSAYIQLNEAFETSNIDNPDPQEVATATQQANERVAQLNAVLEVAGNQELLKASNAVNNLLSKKPSAQMVSDEIDVRSSQLPTRGIQRP